ncbi:MAG: hypothetical protein FJW20_18720 [Acidimicrobiia bacterium]|nr:hypothetical protein [Acidimicrobiia bacterium]
MKHFLALLLLLASSAAAQSPVAAIVQELSEITGWKLNKPIQQETMSRDALKSFFTKRIDEVVKPEEIRIEEITLKKFGFVPQDFNLKETTVDLLSEQAAAFYDYRKKKMVMLESGDMLQQALVHELAHALADQQFSLEKYLKKGASSDDGAVARTAVMEGQATWLMSEYMARRAGNSLIDAPLLVEAMSRMATASSGAFPVFEKVPLYMRESLIFPYARGMVFQQAVVRKLGKEGFSEVFRRPPLTTRHILHPETWFAGEKPVDLEVPKRKGYRVLSDGTIGEFDHSILFRQYANEEASLAESWRGGEYALYEDKKNKRIALAYASGWDTPESASRAMKLWRRVLQGKWKTFEVASESATEISGRGDDGYFRLTVNGSTLTSMEGLESPDSIR